MVTDPKEVRRALRRAVLYGRDPDWDLESVEDHDVNWLVLPKQEFDQIKLKAQQERDLASVR